MPTTHDLEKAAHSDTNLDTWNSDAPTTSAVAHDTASLPEPSSPSTRPPPNRRTQSAPAPIQLDPAVRPSVFQRLLLPQKNLRSSPGWATSFKNIVTYSYMNILLVFVPVSWAVHFAKCPDTIIFPLSMIGIVPLAALLGFATEELADRVGHTLGGVINATFGNAVELIVAILALVKGELRVVQSSMIGSILSNCLLVCGMCFTAGGLRFHEQHYDIRAAQLNISMLGISSLALAIPAVYHASLGLSNDGSDVTDENNILKLSRGTAVVLIILYACYLIYQFWTHAYLYNALDAINNETTMSVNSPGPHPPNGDGNVLRLPSWHLSLSGSTSSSSSSSSEDDIHPKLSARAALVLLVTVTVIIGFTAEWLVSSINGLVSTGSVTQEFVALILLPLVGNASEHAVAVVVSVKGKLDLSLTVAIGSSIQIALFVLPFLILLAWWIGQPLTLFFGIYETVVLFMSMVIVNFAITDGRTNWLEGIVLMFVYVLIAMASWFYPGTSTST